MNWRTAIGISVVLVAAYSVFRHRDDTLTVSSAVPEQPGYYMKDATLIKTDSNTGAPAWRLHAASITRNPSDDSISLQQVNLHYLGGDTTWLLTAQHGYVPKDSRTVNFSGAVNVQPQGDTRMPMVMSTDELNLDTQSNFATAPGKVTIEMNRQHLTAVGLKADLQRQTLRLLTQVHGEFHTQ